LETSNSVQPGEGIKLHHVICPSELVLKEVIGSGAEGKVGAAAAGLQKDLTQSAALHAPLLAGSLAGCTPYADRQGA
jgi:hypothetical protein